MSYVVYIDIRHHPKHADDYEQVEQTAFKMADTTNPLATVADCLRMFADELDARAGRPPSDTTEETNACGSSEVEARIGGV